LNNRPDNTELAALELKACTPQSIDPNGFNPNAILPHGCTIEAIEKAMKDFIDFLGFVNQQLNTTPQIPIALTS
jgi:hypothetical protein